MQAKLTIILTVKDRHALVERWLKFMSGEQCQYKIIIADGSLSTDNGFIFNNGKYPNLDLDYIKFPPDVDYSAYYRKISNALSKVATPYILMADDDDFYCLDGIEKTIGYLEDNADYISARGSYQGFSIKNIDDHIYGDLILHGEIYSSTAINEVLASRRIQQYFENWSPYWYNIQRIEVFKRCWDEVAQLNIKNIFLMEHTLGAKIAARGKMFAGDYPYYFRQVAGNYATTSQQAKQKDGDWFDQMFLETWSEDYNSFLSTVSDDIRMYETIDAKGVIHQSYRNFYAPAVLSAITGNRVGFIGQIYLAIHWAKVVYIWLRNIKNLRNKHLKMREIKSCRCIQRIKIFMIKCQHANESVTAN